MIPIWEIIIFFVSLMFLVGIVSAGWQYLSQQAEEQKKQDEAFANWKRSLTHSPEIHPNWLDENISASPTESLSASPTTTTSFSASISYSPEQDEEWTGSSGTTFVKTAEETFTGVSGTHQFPVMKVMAKDEKCQWCGHRYPLILNGIEVYYCPKCGGPRK